GTETTRTLQLSAPTARAGVVRAARIPGQRRRPWDPPPAGGHPHPWPRKQDPLLSGLDLRALWQSPGEAAKGDDAVLSTLALRGREALRVLDHSQLPRGLRHACLERYSFQPRESNPRRNLRHP